MKFLFFALIFILSACTLSEDVNTPVDTPYPKVPLTTSVTISGEIVIPAPASVATGKSYIARGFEPGWFARVTATGTIVMIQGETTPVEMSYTTTQSDKGAIISIQGVKGDMFLVLTKGECRDANGEKYKYNATLLVRAETLKGCGREE